MVAADSNTGTRMDWEAPPKSSQRQSGGEWKSQLVQNSVVEVSLEAERLMYGTIRWIGMLPEREGLFAGLELVNTSTSKMRSRASTPRLQLHSNQY